MKKFFLILVVFVYSFLLKAQTGPYWATDVAPILYQNCTSCHNANGIAPFSLMTYADAFPNAGAMASEVSNRTMPPWPPDTSYVRFCNERVLSQAEIQTIVDWDANGAQQGNLANAPVPPTYTGSALLLNPDLVAQIPLYTVNTATDLYRCFVVLSGVPTNEFISKIEFIPGNRSIVHHILLYQDQSNTCVNLDNASPGPGYTNFGGVGSNTAKFVAHWVPGQEVYELPANMGIQLLANAKLIFQIHYPGGTFGQIDSTQVRLTFASGLVRNVSIDPTINHSQSLTNGPLFIPADTVKTFYAQEYIGYNVSVISVAPHMHLIGHNITNYAVTPNSDTVPLIQINNWDFHWQGFYNFRQPIHIPLGSTIYAHAEYDNSVNNPHNPNSPPQHVFLGESTNDEMFLVYYAYLLYQFGDENIIIDSTLMGMQDHTFPGLVICPQLYAPFPSPALNNENINIEFYLPNKVKVKIEIVDVNGKTVLVPVQDIETSAGYGSHRLNTNGLAKGTYFVRLSADGSVKTKPIVIQ